MTGGQYGGTCGRLTFLRGVEDDATASAAGPALIIGGIVPGSALTVIGIVPGSALTVIDAVPGSVLIVIGVGIDMSEWLRCR
jgi:hypothetical protein